MTLRSVSLVKRLKTSYAGTMHIYFSGIGGTGIGPLAMIAQQAGYTVSGSDKQDSQYVEYLRKHGVTNISIGQTAEQIAEAHATQPIDWLVYSSALPLENPEHQTRRFFEHHLTRKESHPTRGGWYTRQNHDHGDVGLAVSKARLAAQLQRGC